jgi:hypothetical protein
MKLAYLFFVFIFVFCVKCVPKYDNLKDAVKDYPLQDKRNGKQPKFVYMKFYKSKVDKIDYISKILYQFMSTMGVRPYLVNMNDDTLLGIVAKDTVIDKEIILSQFSDVI